MRRYLPILIIANFALGQDCTADDGTDGVELWDVCYSIENTTELILENNQLTGSIPPEIGNLTNLTNLDLFNNQLTGSIPSELGYLTNLAGLKLGRNQLTGSIPLEIGDLTNLTLLFLFENQLTGSIPSEIGNLTNLTGLALYGNELTGDIPQDIWNLPNLEGLRLNDNQLTGEIPTEIGSNLYELFLNNNQLTGSIPLEIGDLTNLTLLFLFENQLTGSIPSEIGSLTNLTELFLFNNQLSGIIPDEICNQGDSSPSLFGNQFCPPYPSCIEDYVGEQDITNCGQVSVDNETIPITYNLYNAYPNPFNPTTTLQYDLPNDEFVNITIYDMLGNVVNNLVHTSQSSGYKSIQWDATNNQGQQVSAGVYLYSIEAEEFRQTKKMILLK